MGLKNKEKAEFAKIVSEFGLDGLEGLRWLNEIEKPPIERQTKAVWHQVERKRIVDNEEYFQNGSQRFGVRWIDKCYLGDVCIGTIFQERLGLLNNVFITDAGKEFTGSTAAIRSLILRHEKEGFVYKTPSDVIKSFLKGVWDSLKL